MGGKMGLRSGIGLFLELLGSIKVITGGIDWFGIGIVL